VNADDAEDALADAELVPCLQASLTDAKELRAACLEADIPVLLDRAACCGKGGCGCGPKVELLARDEDVPRIARLLDQRWRALALREGTVDEDHPAVAGAGSSDAETVTCPACGRVGPLAEGACGDCGLQLA
jgi:hypothetical protein